MSSSRSKRLAVQAGPEALELRPSPFTIATEDYRYSIRIVAWTPKKKDPGSSPSAGFDFIKFITSDDGQQIVSDSGFVDLRLKPVEAENDPKIMATLGAALNLDSVSNATRLSTNLRFETGSSTLDLKAIADVERLPAYIAGRPNHKVVILGFTDNVGTAANNLDLSIKRAKEVAKILKPLGVNASASGLGEEFPVDSNDTAAGKAKNRRAEVWMVEP